MSEINFVSFITAYKNKNQAHSEKLVPNTNKITFDQVTVNETFETTGMVICI